MKEGRIAMADVKGLKALNAIVAENEQQYGAEAQKNTVVMRSMRPIEKY